MGKCAYGPKQQGRSSANRPRRQERRAGRHVGAKEPTAHRQRLESLAARVADGFPARALHTMPPNTQELSTTLAAQFPQRRPHRPAGRALPQETISFPENPPSQPTVFPCSYVQGRKLRHGCLRKFTKAAQVGNAEPKSQSKQNGSRGPAFHH